MSIRIKSMQKCADCPSMRPYADYFICGLPETDPNKTQMDVSTYKVSPNTKPDWCPIDKVNANLENLTEDQELAVKGMSVLFGAQGAFEDDDKRELARIVRCKDCKHFEYDSVANVDGIPLIVGHEICRKWGEGCKSREDGYCFLFKKKAPIEQQTTDPLVEKLRSCKITEHLEEDLMIRGFNAGIERAIQEITGEDSK